MQLTRAADYAVRVMVHLATLPMEERTSLPALAKAVGAPESFLSKVLQALSRAGLVLSHRGNDGGFELMPRGRKASMHEVIAAIDGVISLNACLMSGKSCARKLHCPAHPVWVKTQEAVLNILDTTMIAALAAQATTLGTLAKSPPVEQKIMGKNQPALCSKASLRQKNPRR